MNTKLVYGLCGLALLSACTADHKVSRIEAPQPAPISVAPPEAKVTISRIEAPTSSARPAERKDDTNGMPTQRSVFYPLDVALVQDADKPLLQTHAQYLRSHPNTHVRIEGNCDERGSNEYNLAIGQRRADGVKKFLLLGGAREQQIETVSFGEERPLAAAHDETAWAKNRRSDLNYAK